MSSSRFNMGPLLYNLHVNNITNISTLLGWYCLHMINNLIVKYSCADSNIFHKHKTVRSLAQVWVKANKLSTTATKIKLRDYRYPWMASNDNYNYWLLFTKNRNKWITRKSNGGKKQGQKKYTWKSQMLKCFSVPVRLILGNEYYSVCNVVMMSKSIGTKYCSSIFWYSRFNIKDLSTLYPRKKIRK